LLPCFFVSDLHGHPERYRKLRRAIEAERPRAVLVGGDLLPHPFHPDLEEVAGEEDFVRGFVVPLLRDLRESLGSEYPRVLVIPGNDDPRSELEGLAEAEEEGLLENLHERKTDLEGFRVYGYAFVPPTPFLLKDWERYDVSRYTDPGCVPPEEGTRTVPVPEREILRATIHKDLEKLAGTDDLERAILLFHSPPYQTRLDRAALDGMQVDHAPLDVHVGSVAVRRFIESRRPLLGLHGHIHESARLTGDWRDRIGRTRLFSAAHDGPELALVRFDPGLPDEATRELV
jgi:Icc-related predicted phosphoesterase